MKMKFKRIIMSVCFAVLIVATFGLCLVACNSGLKITFKEQPYAYLRNDTAYVYDFIEKQDGVSYSFAYDYLTISDSGETVSTKKQEIVGNTIYLNDASVYTLYVTATKGGKSVSDSTTFEVSGDAPIILPVSLSLTRSVGAQARVSVLLEQASPTVIPNASELVVDYYTFQENSAPTLTSSVNTNEKVKVDIDTTDETAKVVFDKTGVYEFHVVATNGGKSADATFKVKVLPDQTATVEGIESYKNAEFGVNADGTTDSSVVRLVGQPDLEKASYVVLEDNFVSGQVARFEFYGQNIPQFGIFTQNFEEVSNPYGITTGLGYLLTTQYSSKTNALSLYGFTRLNESTKARLQYTNSAKALQHFGWDSLEEGKHYGFEFMMKAVDGTQKEKQNDTGCGGVDWEAVEGATNYVISTDESTSNRIAVVDANTLSYDLTEVYNTLDPFTFTKIQVHASTGNNKFSKCVYEQNLLRGDAAWGNTVISGEVLDYDKEKSLLSMKLNGGYYMKSSSYSDCSNSGRTPGYVALGNAASADDKYTLDENGTYVDFYFTGNNMPNVEFFGSSISGNMWNDGKNTGYVVTNGHSSQVLYANYPQIMANNLFNKDLTNAKTDGLIDFTPASTRYNGITNFADFFQFGVSNYTKFKQGQYATKDTSQTFYYSLYNKNTTPLWTVDTKMGGSNFSMFSLMQDETQKWHYVIGMYLKGNDVYVDAKLYKVDANGNDVDADTTTTVIDAYASYNAVVETLADGVVRSGYIVAHAAHKGLANYALADYKEYTYTKFTCTKPYAGDASKRA